MDKLKTLLKELTSVKNEIDDLEYTISKQQNKLSYLKNELEILNPRVMSLIIEYLGLELGVFDISEFFKNDTPKNNDYYLLNWTEAKPIYGDSDVYLVFKYEESDNGHYCEYVMYDCNAYICNLENGEINYSLPVYRYLLNCHTSSRLLDEDPYFEKPDTPIKFKLLDSYISDTLIKEVTQKIFDEN